MRTADRGGMEGGAGQVALAVSPDSGCSPPAHGTGAMLCGAGHLATSHSPPPTDIVNSPQWLCVVTSWTVFSVLSLCADFFFSLFYKGVWNCEYSRPVIPGACEPCVVASPPIV